MKSSFLSCVPFIILTAVAGCGGGGGGGPTDPMVDPDPNFPAFASESATGSVDVTAASLDSAARSTSLETGTLNRDADTLSFGTLSGSINADRSSVSLTGGGQASISIAGTEFAGRFVATPLNGRRTIGIIGIDTPAADLPSGSASYAGTSEVTILDNGNIYALTGDATIDANFGVGSVGTTVSNLSGTVQIGATAPVNVSDVATIEVLGSPISGSTFSGGNPNIQTNVLSGFTGEQDTTLSGAFYGPSADEVGVTMIIDDIGVGDLTIFGTVLAD